MKLRNAHLAIVERHKVVDYLLNSAHPDNGGKAQFFESLGFSADVPQLLIDALRSVAHTAEVVEIVQSSHGEKYIADGRCRRKLKAAPDEWCGPSGSSIAVWTRLGW